MMEFVQCRIFSARDPSEATSAGRANFWDKNKTSKVPAVEECIHQMTNIFHFTPSKPQRELKSSETAHAPSCDRPLYPKSFASHVNRLRGAGFFTDEWL